MRYVCSKNYKILCKEDCYHVKNIKEENKVWFDTVAEGLEYGCRPCKYCKPDNEIYIDTSFFIPNDSVWVISKINTEDLMSNTMEITGCERIIFRDKTLDFQFEIGHDQYKNIDTIIVNGVKFKKE